MKKTILTLFILLTLLPSISYGNEYGDSMELDWQSYPLNKVYLSFYSGLPDLKDQYVEDIGLGHGFSIGFELYVAVVPRLYLGFNGGRVINDGRFRANPGDPSTYTQMRGSVYEMNAAYVIPLNREVYFMAGGGRSRLNIKEKWFTKNKSDCDIPIICWGSSYNSVGKWDDSLYADQYFASLVLRLDEKSFLSIGGKKVHMEDFEGSQTNPPYDYSYKTAEIKYIISF